MTIRIVDVRKERAEESKKREQIRSMADEYFGSGRVSYSGKGFVGSEDYVYVDRNENPGNSIESRIEIRAGELSTDIRVYDEGVFEEARGFARKYEETFPKDCLVLEHNLK